LNDSNANSRRQPSPKKSVKLGWLEEGRSLPNNVKNENDKSKAYGKKTTVREKRSRERHENTTSNGSRSSERTGKERRKSSGRRGGGKKTGRGFS